MSEVWESSSSAERVVQEVPLDEEDIEATSDSRLLEVSPGRRSARPGDLPKSPTFGWDHCDERAVLRGKRHGCPLELLPPRYGGTRPEPSLALADALA